MEKETEQAEPALGEVDSAESLGRVSELEKLAKLVNRPITDDFLKGVQFEAAYQVKLWGQEHDAEKSPEDWMFLFGWLAGKATQARKSGNEKKAKHHAITAAAALYNWHASIGA